MGSSRAQPHRPDGRLGRPRDGALRARRRLGDVADPRGLHRHRRPRRRLRELPQLAALLPDGRRRPPARVTPTSPGRGSRGSSAVTAPGTGTRWWKRSSSRGTTGCTWGRGYAFFYNLCLSDPGNGRNAERARRYAGFYLNEDPEALNYDPEKKLIRCAHNGSMGPAFRNFDKHYTVYRYDQWKPWPLPFHDLPGIDSVEDLQKPGMEELMGRTLVERMGRGDVATNLGATTLVANAFLFGGEAKYRDWVVEYTEGWMERARENGGVIPDNVGLSGKIGEYIDGKWWGGYYGWTWPHGWHLMADPVTAAAENAALLCRDPGYMDFPALADRPADGEGGKARPDRVRPRITTTTRDGTGTGPMHPAPMTHVWQMTMRPGDAERLVQQPQPRGGRLARHPLARLQARRRPRGRLVLLAQGGLPRVPSRHPAPQPRPGAPAAGVHARRPAGPGHLRRLVPAGAQPHHRGRAAAADHGRPALPLQRRPAGSAAALLRLPPPPSRTPARRRRPGGGPRGGPRRRAAGEPQRHRAPGDGGAGRRLRRAPLHQRLPGSSAVS